MSNQIEKNESARTLFERYQTEINKHDFDLIEPLVSKKCQFWFSTGTYIGIEQSRQAFEKTWALIKEEVYTMTDLNWVAQSDRAAVCTYTYHWKGFVEGKLVEGKGRGTSCLRREDEGWKIVHEHLSL